MPDHATVQPYEKQMIGIISADPMNRRLLESASQHLGLTSFVTTLEDLRYEDFSTVEILLADQPVADEILARLRETKRQDDPYRPAVIALIPADFNIGDENVRENYDGVLPMPQLPDALSAQLSVALYSHRSFARRYEDHMEELQMSRRIFGSVTSGISIAAADQPDLPLVYVNPAFEVLTGYTLEETRGRNCRFLQGDHRDQPALTLIREAIRDGKSTVAILRNFKKNGTAFWNELALSPIRGRDGTITHFIGIQEDVTERVEFEQALRQSEKLAVTGRLAAAIAHEINNPLESITNLTYLARGSSDIKEVHAYLDSLDTELRRVKLITSQSLRFARQSTRPEAMDAAALLDSILDIQHARLQAAHVQVFRRYRFRQSFIGLESEIRQVLNNFISNATDAMRAKPDGRIYVRSRHATNWENGKQGVMFTIADTGEGLSDDARTNLFKAFFTTKESQGTGLGLWVSSEIVERHHGTIRFRSRRTGRPQSGTVFQLFLPYQSAVPEADDAASQH